MSGGAAGGGEAGGGGAAGGGAAGGGGATGGGGVAGGGGPGADGQEVATSEVGPTVIHRWVARCRAGLLESAVIRLPSGWVIMGERQVFVGYCLLLPDPVVPHLNALSGAARADFLGDMGRVGDALLAETGAARVNYALFGNLEPALHAHIFPRHADEPAETRTAQPWALDWTRAPVWSEAAHGDLQLRLRARLTGG